MSLRPFHLALPVKSLENARQFYTGILNCPEGRSDTTWVDFNFFGHQLVFHLDPSHQSTSITNPVDNHAVPVPHMGILLKKDDWLTITTTISNHQLPFIIEPYIRFKGQPGEQGTCFLYDFNHIALEFKYFESDDKIFETN